MMLANSSKRNDTYPKKRSLDDRGDDDIMNSSREGSLPPSPTRPKTNHREPEEVNSPGTSNISRDDMSIKYSKNVSYPTSMETDSPASYPKHVIVPSPPDSNEQRQQSLEPHPTSHFMDNSPPSKKLGDKVVTPIHTNETRQLNHSGYVDGPVYHSKRGGGYPHRGSEGYGHGGYYRNPAEIDLGHSSYGRGGMPPQQHPKKWACDYHCGATFLTFEEACAHEEACSTRFGVVNRQRPYQTNDPHMYHPHRQQPQQPNGGLGTLYQATQEVHHYSPRMPPPPHPHHDPYHHPSPHQHHHHRYPPPQHWGGAPPQMPSDRTGYANLSPRFQDFRMYNDRHDPMPTHHRAYPQHNPRRIFLAMPSDADSLSDRQCYVRSEFVEVFAATEKDVSARHSKGAQKLVLGQVGIRCIHCSHLRPKDRAERAVCYPSSISRIYQTVADMQRFHFEQCREIPDEIRKIYKSLKTTRPRGVGSPQTYWVQSAKLMNLIDSDGGIRFGHAGGNNSDS